MPFWMVSVLTTKVLLIVGDMGFCKSYLNENDLMKQARGAFSVANFGKLSCQMERLFSSRSKLAIPLVDKKKKNST